MVNDDDTNRAGSSDRSIGEILVSIGRLSPDDVARIFVEQKKRGIHFGDAAIALGLATEEDVRFALSHQFRYPYLQRGESKVSEKVVAAYDPFSPQVEALRAVRSQLMLRWIGTGAGNKALAIVSPGRGEGRSWLSANLAVVFSQLGARTLLVDADLRHPTQHRLFGIDNRSGLSSILGGRATSNVVFRIQSLLDLSILPSGPVPPNPQELLARPLLGRMLLQLGNSFDVILIDTPPASEYAESMAIAARAGGALVVSRQNQTRIQSLNEVLSHLGDAGATVIGSVLNRGEGTGNFRLPAPSSPAFVGEWLQLRAARSKSGATKLIPDKRQTKPGKHMKVRALPKKTEV